MRLRLEARQTWSFRPGDPQGGNTEMLKSLLGRLRYKDGWSFQVEGGYLTTQFPSRNSLDRTQTCTVNDVVVIPAEPFGDEAAAVRWLFDRITDLERHEAMEWFRVGAVAPYWPHDRPGSQYEVKPNPRSFEPSVAVLSKVQMEELERAAVSGSETAISASDAKE